MKTIQKSFLVFLLIVFISFFGVLIFSDSVIVKATTLSTTTDEITALDSSNTLNNLNIVLDKETVHPDEEVNLEIDFGQELSSYNISVAYDKNLFEYVSTNSPGLVNDNGNIIEIQYLESSQKINNVSVKFKAKSEIITTNPTDLKVTLQELYDANTFERIDNPLTPIGKNLIVEPEYTDYTIILNYQGDIIVNQEKDIQFKLKSAMGKNYEKTRIITNIVTPEGATVKILGTDEEGVTHDIIESGWGSENGDPIGGKEIEKELNFRGIFDKIGNYSITFKVIDLKNNNAEIASETFNIEVISDNPIDNLESNNLISNQISAIANTQIENTITNQTTNESVNTMNTENTKPTTLPKAGNTMYLIFVPILTVLILAYNFYRRKEKNNI